MKWRALLFPSIALLLAVSVLIGCGSKSQPTATPESILPAHTPTPLAVVSLATAETPADTPTATLVPPETPTPTMTPIAVMATYEKPTDTPTATLVPPEPPTPTWTAMPMAPTATLVPPEPPTPTWTVMPMIPRPPVPLPCGFGAEGEFAALWQNYKSQLGCPLYPSPKLIQDAEQPFDNGRMFWREDNRYVYVVYEKGALAGTYQVFLDEWEEGDPEYPCAGTAPANRLQPKRGFGLVWCKLGGPAAAIGWGLEEEAGFWTGKGDPLVHDFGSGVIFRDSAGTVSGAAYVLFSSTGTFVHVTY